MKNQPTPKHTRRLRGLAAALLLASSTARAATVELAPVDPFTFHVVVRGDAAFRGGEIGLRFPTGVFVFDEALEGPDFPRGDALPGGIATVNADPTPEDSCAADPELDGALTVAWVHPIDGGTALALPGNEQHRVLTLRFTAGPDAVAGACSTLRFASCLGPAIAPARNVLTGADGDSMPLTTVDRIACNTSCRVVRFEAGGTTDCETLAVEIRETTGGLIDERDVEAAGRTGYDLAPALLADYRERPVAGFTFAEVDSGVQICRGGGGGFAVLVDGKELEVGRSAGACGVDAVIELPECPDDDGDGSCNADDCRPDVFNATQDDCPSLGFCRRVKFDPLCAFRCPSLTFELREGDGETPIGGSRRTVSIEGNGTGRDVGVEFCRAYLSDLPPGFTAHATRSGCTLCRTDGSPFRIFLEHLFEGESRVQEITTGGVTAACGLRIWSEPPGCPDRDGDGVCDAVDRCPDDFDPSQGDLDGDCRGDACQQNGAAVLCEGPPVPIEPGGSRDFVAALDSCTRSACVSFAADAVGQPIAIDLSDADESNANTLRFQWGREASPSDFFAAATKRGSSSQRLVIASARSETGYVLVESAARTASSDVTVRVEVLDLALERLAPSRGAPGTRLTAEVHGAGFTEDTEFELVAPDGEPAIAIESRTFIGEALVEVTLAIPEGSTPGKLYGLAATDGDVAFPVLEGALEIIPIGLATGLEVSLFFGDFYRQRVVSRGTLRLRNHSTEEMIAPIVEITTRFRESGDPRQPTGPTQTNLRLRGERVDLEDPAVARRRVLVLGADPSGVAGRLAPGAAVDIPIVFRNVDPACFFCFTTFEARLLLPLPTDRVDWDSLEPPVCLDGAGWNVESWEALRRGLRIELGDTWNEVHANLARIATRIGRRGVPATSVRDLLRFAARRVRGLPAAAIAGRLVDADTLTPVAATAVVALRGGDVVAGALTDASGRFSIGGLENGATYRLEADRRIGGLQVGVPEIGDRLGVSLELPYGDGAPARELPALPDCAGDPLPPDAPLLPLELLVKAAEERTVIVGAFDPNEKDGPEGLGPRGLIGSEEEILYTIYFENKPNVGAAARRIVITDRIHENLDMTTLRLLDVNVGGRIVNVDQERYFSRRPLDHLEAVFADFFQGELDYSLETDVNVATRTVTWTFDTLHRGSEVPLSVTDDPRLGMLPPNTTRPLGEGSVSFSIRVRPGLEDDDPVTNRATIRFDDNASIVTEPVVNAHSLFLPADPPRNPRVDYPRDPRAPLAPVLSWEATKNAESWDVRLWRIEDDRSRTALELAEGQAVVEGLRAPGIGAPELEHERDYEWRIDAHNIKEHVTTGELWRFRTPSAPLPQRLAFVRGDIDSSGSLDITDAIVLLGWRFLGEPPPACLDAADVDDGGDHNITDAIFLLQFLFLGTAPPPDPGPTPGEQLSSGNCGPDPTPDDFDCEEVPPLCEAGDD